MSFVGFVELESTLPLDVLVTSGGAPVNSDALPTYRVYGPQGLVLNGTGSAAFKDTGGVTNAANTGPIGITSAGHGLTTGTRVTVSGVTGNTAANGAWTITVSDVDTFTLNGSNGNGNYVAGGTWNVSGLYEVSIQASGNNGFEAGETYTVLISGAISATAWATLLTFTVT